MPSQAISLRDAVQTAIQTNPDVGIVIERRRAVEYEVKQAKSALYPEVDVRIAYGPEWVTDPATRARLRDNDNDSDVVRLPRSEVGITVRQLLFDGFAAVREIDRQEARVRSSSKRVRETSELVALEAIKAYLETLRQRELLELLINNVRIHENYLLLTRSNGSGGASSQADIEQAESRLASAHSYLAEAEGRLIDADSTYNRIVGEEPKDLVRPAVPLNQLPQSLDSVVGLATDMNPTVRVLRADADIAEEALKAANAGFSPRLDLQLATNRAGNVGGIRGGDIDGSALVVLTYNVFRGGRDLARKRELAARLLESRQRLNRQLRLAEEKSRLSWNALQNARSRLSAIYLEVQANERVRNTYRQQFDIGQTSLLDLLDAENELFISKANQLKAEFIELFGSYRILATAGLLLTSLNLAPANAPHTVDEGARPMNGGAAPVMRDPAGNVPITPHDKGIKPTYVPPQQGIAPMGRPIAPHAAPVLRGAPPAGVGAPLPDPVAPVLEPNAPATPKIPATAPAQSYRTAGFPNTSRSDDYPVKYPKQPANAGTPQSLINTAYLPPLPAPPVALVPPVYVRSTTQQVRSTYPLLDSQTQHNPVTKYAPLQLSSRQKVAQRPHLAAPNAQAVALQRSSAARVSYWGF